VPVKSKLNVVLCWHMHQPEYRDAVSGRYQLPWTYLHTIKDYVDMAAILEKMPKARAVVNFVPILLDQIEDYARQVHQYLTDGGYINDPLLAALAMPSLPNTQEERIALIKDCLRANEQRLINRYPPYRKLAKMATMALEDQHIVDYFHDGYLVDILMWYHLAWLGETVHREDTRVQLLIEKGKLFSLKDRRCLLEVIGEILGNIINRFRKLAENGQIELSMTPHAHAMLPLLLDFKCAREAMPDVVLPHTASYPGGLERAHWHIREGIAAFKRHFGIEAKGCWPAEGGVSESYLELLGKYGFTWAASGETVIRNSLAKPAPAGHTSTESGLHLAHHVKGKGPACFFRDDGLSDLIGFTYSTWHADDAVSNLISHLETIANGYEGDNSRIVSIILDGENAWEYYPENGFHFLTALYKRLSEHPGLNLTTFSDYLAKSVTINPLPALVAGSWVHGTFSTWIGDVDKNRGWDLLCEAKLAFDAAAASGKLTAEQLKIASRQLAVCEGSDWFWWFGDYNPAESVSNFEHLFRLHLSRLYQLIGKESPESLTQVISHGSGTPIQGGVMRTGQMETS
jgi:alpha-amylase/alpha-mannosidase (GH57 family)